MKADTANWFVEVGGSHAAISPAVLKVEIGDSVTFVNRGGVHNVVADDGAFRCAHGCDGDGQGGNGAPSSQLWHAEVTFTDAGHVGYFCETHGAPGVGMYGTIEVAARAPPTQPSAIPAIGLLSCAVLTSVIIVIASRIVRAQSEHLNAISKNDIALASLSMPPRPCS